MSEQPTRRRVRKDKHGRPELMMPESIIRGTTTMRIEDPETAASQLVSKGRQRGPAVGAGG